MYPQKEITEIPLTSDIYPSELHIYQAKYDAYAPKLTCISGIMLIKFWFQIPIQIWVLDSVIIVEEYVANIWSANKK